MKHASCRHTLSAFCLAIGLLGGAAGARAADASPERSPTPDFDPASGFYFPRDAQEPIAPNRRYGIGYDARQQLEGGAWQGSAPRFERPAQGARGRRGR